MSSETHSRDPLIRFSKDTAPEFQKLLQIYSFIKFPSFLLILSEEKIILLVRSFRIACEIVRKTTPLRLSLWHSLGNKWGHWILCYMLGSEADREERTCYVSYQSSDRFTGFFPVLFTQWTIKALLTHINLGIPWHWLAISIPRRRRNMKIQSCGFHIRPAKDAEQCRL